MVETGLSQYEFVGGRCPHCRPLISPLIKILLRLDENTIIILYLDGNKPPTLKVLTEKEFWFYEGIYFYVDKHSKDMGLIDDPDLKAEIVEALSKDDQQSVIHKILWKLSDQLLSEKTSNF